MNRLAPVCLCALLGTPLPAARVFAQPAAPPAAVYAPAKTVVALLPVFRKSDAKEDKKNAAKEDPLADRHAAKAREELAHLFVSRGFVVADPAAVGQAIADAKIDLSDEDNQRRAVFYQIGRAVHADLVVFVVIESVSRHNKSNSFFGSQKEGKALLKLWLVDADRQQPILNAVQHEGKSASSGLMDNGVLPDSNGYTRYTIRAVGHGLDDILADFLKPYPELKK